MAYLQQTSWRDRPAAVVGVIAIHALAGYVLINGLSFTQIIKGIDNPDAVNVTVPLDPPPPPPDPSPKDEADPIDRPVTVPLPPFKLPTDRPVVDSTPIILPPLDPIVRETPGPTPSPSTRPSPAFDPVAARPRGDPRSWVTEADYRSSWINRGMVGTARFRLQVAAGGRVENCTITGSSGFAELDKATCELVTRRARFDPAKDASGAATPGSYSSSVRWQLPE
jgi:protein TonB